jgi:hypothetical protein
MGGTVRKKTKSGSKTAKVKSASRPSRTSAKRTASKARPSLKPVVSTKKVGNKERAQRPKRRTAKQLERTVNEFRSVVNIPSDQLERWLSTPESNKIHFANEPKLKTGNKESGSAVLSLLRKKRDKYTDADLDQMEDVVQFVRQRLEKRPKGDIVASNWRYSLMNWGHDPTKRPRRISK